MTKSIIITALILLGLGAAAEGENIYFNLPKPLPPEQYGNLLINRTSEQNNVKPVSFSHWMHRVKYTCRVCHTELEFNFGVNTTEITEAANQRGEYCGACHNGKEVFGHTKENCGKCHNGDRAYGSEKFEPLRKLPKQETGNGINWVTSVSRGYISPKATLKGEYQPMSYNKELQLAAEWDLIPPAVFSHKSHNLWLDCSNCHPEIFNIKKKTTKHFSMERNLKAEFCGACHLRVAFNLDDCKRCHPEMKK